MLILLVGGGVGGLPVMGKRPMIPRKVALLLSAPCLLHSWLALLFQCNHFSTLQQYLVMAGSWLEHWEVLTQTCIFLGTRSGMVSTHACHEPSDGRRRKRAKWNEKPSRETWKHNATGVHFVTTTVRTQRAGKPRKSDSLTPCTLSEFLPALSLSLACY